MGTIIHPTAIIESGVELDDDVKIGPYCYLFGKVKILKGSELVSHVVVGGNTNIGANNKIYPFASIGLNPQDLKYKGEPSILEIGNHNIIREYVTMQPGTEGGGMVTKIGDKNLFMAYSHVAHDCKVGNCNIFSNSVNLAGHVEVGNYTVLGGLSGIHQFVRLGDYCFVAGGSMVRQDIPPFISVQGDSARAYGINRVGLERNGFDEEDIKIIKDIYKIFFLGNFLRGEKIQKLENMRDHLKNLNLKRAELVEKFLTFVNASTRGIVSHGSG